MGSVSLIYRWSFARCICVENYGFIRKVNFGGIHPNEFGASFEQLLISLYVVLASYFLQAVGLVLTDCALNADCYIKSH